MVYPGGEERVRWQLETGAATMSDTFGLRGPPAAGPRKGPSASGRWPRWRSRASAGPPAASRAGQQPQGNQGSSSIAAGTAVYRFGAEAISCLFRDDGLSDLIGFTYADWHADDAVANLVHHLERIAEACNKRQNCLVSIILDGENAWEWYPENGFYFLSQLYTTLADHPELA